MSQITIAGVLRAGAYSPNHIGHDASIFYATADELRKRGCKVNVYSEEQFRDMDIAETVVLAMCREQDSIRKLQQLEDEGKLVINSGYGIENCTRERMTRILLGHGLPYPDSLIVDTNESVLSKLEESGISACWIKRGDTHGMHKEDVTYCRGPQDVQETVKEFFYRGIKKAVINRHVQGSLVKFYGVRGEGFFYCCPYDNGSGEKGDLTVQFDIEALKATCNRGAEMMGIMVYGGDCIIGSDGSVTIININDWPSFAPCRAEAAPHIAKAVMAAARQHIKNGK